MKNNKGFTLVEILSVIVIIAILSGVVIVAVNIYITKGKEEFNKSIESTLVSNAKDYYSENLSELPNGRLDENAPRYVDVLWASELLSQGYYTNEIVDANENNCSTSYVVVENNGSNNYTYTPCVVCENGYNTESDKCIFVGASNDTTKPTCKVETKNILTIGETIWTKNGDKIQLSLTGSDNTGIAGFYANGKFVTVNDNGEAAIDIDYDLPEDFQFVVYDKNNNVGICSLGYDVNIDKVVPAVSIKATKKSSKTSVESNTWSNEGLNFTLTQGTVGGSGATIYYCQDTANTCNPTTKAESGTSITTYNTLTGTYYIRYKIISGVGKESETYSYTAKVDTTNPVCKLSVAESGITFESKTDSNGIIEYGMGTSNSAVYNSTDSLELGLGTFYGYVKDGAGNTNTCSATITKTNISSYTKTTRTCGITNLVCWDYRSYACPSGYSYCSWCSTSNCYKYYSYSASYGVIDSYKEYVTGGDSEAWDCNKGYTKTSFDGQYIYCSKYGYYCNNSSYTLSGSTCYRYSYSYYNYWCDEGTMSGSYCYLYNQGTSCPSGWEISDYTEYGFTTSIEEVTTCEEKGAFTCNENESGSSYATCAPKYGCSSGTKLNDNYCYEIK